VSNARQLAENYSRPLISPAWPMTRNRKGIVMTKVELFLLIVLPVALAVTGIVVGGSFRAAQLGTSTAETKDRASKMGVGSWRSSCKSACSSGLWAQAQRSSLS